ncbi:helix-turn-helix transcriptional regulator [Streptomyces sp. NBC_00378]|uniref:helix-turn-helix transcriptional regulator n=1 Tax=unclassified Streptomyces TaxID=2593676 RepID=UPI00338F0111
MQRARVDEPQCRDRRAGYRVSLGTPGRRAAPSLKYDGSPPLARRGRRNPLPGLLTQEKLADRAGVSRDTVQRIEHATTNLRQADLLRIARALDTRLADLLQEQARLD